MFGYGAYSATYKDNIQSLRLIVDELNLPPTLHHPYNCDSGRNGRPWLCLCRTPFSPCCVCVFETPGADRDSSSRYLVVNIEKPTYVEEIRLPGILFAPPTPRNIPTEITMEIHKMALPRICG
jgi:hypothetical protein